MKIKKLKKTIRQPFAKSNKGKLRRIERQNARTAKTYHALIAA